MECFATHLGLWRAVKYCGNFLLPLPLPLPFLIAYVISFLGFACLQCMHAGMRQRLGHAIIEGNGFIKNDGIPLKRGRN